MAESIGFRSSGVKRTEIPGARALAFETLGLPAFLRIKIIDVIRK
jgi:hypothetical protein